jgi:hypothetical protein
MASEPPAAPVPIETHLHELATARNPPEPALRACVSRYDEAGPAIRAVLDRAAAGEELSENDATLLFRGLYIAGACRDQLAFEPLLRLLRRPEDELDWLLGDGLTESTARIATGVFNGDVEALFEAIVDSKRNEYVRAELLSAATFLTWEGRIDRERMIRFLERFCEERLADDGDFVWVDWMEAVGMLGLRSLVPLADKVWSEGRLPYRAMDRKDLDQDLADAEARPDDVGRFERTSRGYIGDVVRALEWTRRGEDKRDGSEEERWRPYSDMFEGPVRNPMRHVGRNDPCPCGSGKKAKRCCLAAG